eukprot:8150059-Alexandrium_andersonii.AAC.1
MHRCGRSHATYLNSHRPEDTGVLVRLLSVAVYALPLMDAVKLGMPLLLVPPFYSFLRMPGEC